MSIAFLLTTLAVVVTPGAGVLYTPAAGLAHGRRASVVAAFGCTLGVVPHLAASVTGLAALLHTSAVAYDILKYLGAAYLLHLAWVTWRDRSTLTVDAQSAPSSAGRVIASAVLLNLLNPKLTLFFVAFLPQFVPGRPPGAADSSGFPGSLDSLGQMVQLGGIFMLLTFLVFVAYGTAAAALRHRVLDRPGVLTGLRRLFAVCFVGLSARLAVA